VPRIRTLAVCCVTSLMTLSMAALAPAVDRSETLLPDTTVAFVSISDVSELRDHFDRTQFGKLLNDPIMKPFREDLERQFHERWSSVEEKLGLTFDDLQGVPGGETAVAIIQLADDQSALVMLIDVTGKVPKAEEMLETVTASLIGRGAKRTSKTISETAMVVFDLPEEEDGHVEQTAVYFLKDSLLGVSDDANALEGIIRRMAGGKGDVLAEDERFKVVMDRCQEDAGEWTPQIRWFVKPFGYMGVIREATPERDRRRGRPIIDLLRSQGFDAFQSVGGFVDLAVDEYELLHRTALFAPQPHEKAMKMMVFPNNTEFTPQPWVPRDVATYYTGYVDILAAFDNFGSMFDEMFGEGDTGVWEEVLEGFRDDPYGPQIDLRAEVVSKLGNRVTVITDYELPITPESERVLFALDVTDEEGMADALDKMLKPDTEGPDPSRRIRTFELSEGKEIIIWETLPVEKPAVPTISLDALPPLGGEEVEDEDDVGPDPIFPNTAITVAHGELFVASHLQFLLKVLKQREDERETLGGAVDFKLVEAKCKESGAGENCFRVFSRADEEYRPTYELIRQGKMPESETLLGRTLNTIFGVGPEGVLRKQEVDGGKLPEFEVVRRHLGFAGAFGVTEENGWFFKGFMVPK
jgi:hypothetical protein